MRNLSLRMLTKKLKTLIKNKSERNIGKILALILKEQPITSIGSKLSTEKLTVLMVLVAI